jgi:hypothetical protein
MSAMQTKLLGIFKKLKIYEKSSFYDQAPDIDSVCIIKSRPAKPGEFIDTKVVGTKDYDLLVEQI